MKDNSNTKSIVSLSLAQKQDFAKLIEHEGYKVKEVMKLSGAGETAVRNWHKKYLSQLVGNNTGSSPLTEEQKEIQLLRQQLWQSRRENDILKKSCRLSRKEMNNVEIVSKLSKEYKRFSITELCRLFDVSSSVYYYKNDNKSKKDNNIVKTMKIISLESNCTYGKRKLRTKLNALNIKIGIYKTASLMKKNNIVAIYPKKNHYYARGNTSKIAPNLLNREFNQNKANRYWVADITFIRNDQGWSYLAVVLDLATRAIVGWSISKTADSNLVIDALSDAIKRYKPDLTKLLFHSDQGTQYTSNVFVNYCNSRGITLSMSRKGNCWDNAVVEKFFRSLKTEGLREKKLKKHCKVIRDIESYIYFYNFKRIHSSIDYMTPMQKMNDLTKKAA